MSKAECIDKIINEARNQGYPVEDSRNGSQIDFGNGKKLHKRHLTDLCPDILKPGAHIPTLIERVAPGRPCAHRPMREIVEAIRGE